MGAVMLRWLSVLAGCTRPPPGPPSFRSDARKILSPQVLIIIGTDIKRLLLTPESLYVERLIWVFTAPACLDADTETLRPKPSARRLWG
jgi:hypothetical protein